MDIGIENATGGLVVLVVVLATASVGQGRVKPEGDGPESIVEGWPGGHQHPVHGVVSNDEQACVQKRSHQNSDQDEDRVQARQIQPETQQQAQ
jgi:hypothetical protein